jgi:hypothetical protein
MLFHALYNSMLAWLLGLTMLVAAYRILSAMLDWKYLGLPGRYFLISDEHDI